MNLAPCFVPGAEFYARCQVLCPVPSFVPGAVCGSGVFACLRCPVSTLQLLVCYVRYALWVSLRPLSTRWYVRRSNSSLLTIVVGIVGILPAPLEDELQMLHLPVYRVQPRFMLELLHCCCVSRYVRNLQCSVAWHVVCHVTMGYITSFRGAASLGSQTGGCYLKLWNVWDSPEFLRK